MILYLYCLAKASVGKAKFNLLTRCNSSQAGAFVLAHRPSARDLTILLFLITSICWYLYICICICSQAGAFVLAHRPSARDLTILLFLITSICWYLYICICICSQAGAFVLAHRPSAILLSCFSFHQYLLLSLYLLPREALQ